MTQIEIEIQKLEASLETLNKTIKMLGAIVPTAIQQQKTDLENELAQKRLQLNAQNKETIYEHLSRIVGYSNDLKDCIEDTVDKLLVTNISNASDPGLLLGKIQCVDAPEDGNTDTPVARQHTLGPSSRPFFMLFRENGLENIVKGKNIGWRNAPFYWPCLRLPQNIESCVYCK